MSDALSSRPFDRQLAALLVESYSVDWQQVPAERLPHLLAARFDYDVKQGGFAQLLYNMQGNCLGEIEDMLIAAQVAIAATPGASESVRRRPLHSINREHLHRNLLRCKL